MRVNRGDARWECEAEEPRHAKPFCVSLDD